MTDPIPAPPDAAPPKPAATAPAPAAPLPPAASVPAAGASAPPSPLTPAPTVPRPAGAADTTKPPTPKPAAAAATPRPAPPAAAASAPPAAAPGAQTHPMRGALPVLTAIGFIFVFLGIVWIWNSQQDLTQRLVDLAARPMPVPPPSADPARVAALETRLTDLEQRLATVQQGLTTLQNRPVPEAAPAPAAAISPDNAAALASQMADLEQRLKQAEQRQGTLAQREALAQRLEQAQTALDAGEVLGDIPGAPPALARFARGRPPTEASLRLAFPAAAAAAEQASRPSIDGKSLGERILMHASSLFTVKQGNRVVVGAPAATVLGEADARLEAGDLAGALATLDGLDSAAAQAMAGWRGDAKALLDARAALAQMARG